VLCEIISIRKPISILLTGWTPSTFVSSRSERAKGRAARPEDFMDEEDLTEMRDDLKLVDEHEQMDLAGGTQSEMNRRGDGADVEKECAPSYPLLTYNIHHSPGHFNQRNYPRTRAVSPPCTKRLRRCSHTQEDGVAYRARYWPTDNMASA
jgi:hypothetical protein